MNNKQIVATLRKPLELGPGMYWVTEDTELPKVKKVKQGPTWLMLLPWIFGAMK